MKLLNTEIYNDFQSEKIIKQFSYIIQQDKPLFFGRIGGSDYEIVKKWFNNKKQTLLNSNGHIEKIKNFNGYFDFENKIENFIKFLNDMLKYYENMDHFTFGGSKLMNQFKKNDFNKMDFDFINHLQHGKTFTFNFIEQSIPFLNSFKIWGEGKKILIISPFSKSINYQVKRKEKLYKEYIFPDFELLTLNSPITYNTNEDTKETLQVTTNNWLEEVEKLKNEINKLKFDIALLSCGSYAMSLGSHIKNIGKQSIYVGGALNPIFSIYGERYNLKCNENQRDLKYQINAFENEVIKKIKGGRNFGTESLGAYFGYKK